MLPWNTLPSMVIEWGASSPGVMAERVDDA
jgi:hypothetical protein